MVYKFGVFHDAWNGEYLVERCETYAKAKRSRDAWDRANPANRYVAHELERPFDASVNH